MTSQTYADTLLSYIKKYILQRYDEFEPEHVAPDGFLWIVQVGAYKSLNNAKQLQQDLESCGIISLINQYKVAE